MDTFYAVMIAVKFLRELQEQYKSHLLVLKFSYMKNASVEPFFIGINLDGMFSCTYAKIESPY